MQQRAAEDSHVNLMSDCMQLRRLSLKLGFKEKQRASTPCPHSTGDTTYTCGGRCWHENNSRQTSAEGLCIYVCVCVCVWGGHTNKDVLAKRQARAVLSGSKSITESIVDAESNTVHQGYTGQRLGENQSNQTEMHRWPGERNLDKQVQLRDHAAHLCRTIGIMMSETTPLCWAFYIGIPIRRLRHSNRRDLRRSFNGQT